MRSTQPNGGTVRMRDVVIHCVPPASFGVLRRLSVSVTATVIFAGPLPGQSIQYRSPAGIEYRAQPDTRAIARGESALGAGARDTALSIGIRLGQSGGRQHGKAIETFTR